MMEVLGMVYFTCALVSHGEQCVEIIGIMRMLQLLAGS